MKSSNSKSSNSKSSNSPPAQSPAAQSPAAASRVVALGASAEGLQVLSAILAKLPAGFPAPIVIAQHPAAPHLSPQAPGQVADILSRRTALRVKEAKEGERLQPGTVYLAPPARHLVIRPDETLALLETEMGLAIDVLFDSLAESLSARSIGVVLTDEDGLGAAGTRAIKAAGGITLAQDFRLPRQAAVKEAADFVLPLPEIAATLVALVSEPTHPQSSPVIQFSSGPHSSGPHSSGTQSPAPEKRASSAAPKARLSARSEPVESEPLTAAPVSLAANALDRVQAAWRSAEDFPGDGAGTQPVGRLTIKALEELDDCVDTLRFAEKVLLAQNDALESLQQAMRDERLCYQALLEIVSDAVITTDLTGMIRAVNPAAARLLGRNAKYMVGRPIDRYVQHGQRLAAESDAAQALEAEDERQTVYLRTRGGAAAVSATASAIENLDGTVISLHWLVRLKA